MKKTAVILIAGKKWIKICEDDFCKTRRRTPQGCRLARTTTQYCENQTAKNVYFLSVFSIISLAALIILFAASCAEQSVQETAVTAYQPTSYATQASTATEVGIKAETVVEATEKATSKSNKNKTKKATESSSVVIDVPTQGVTKRNNRIQVTTVKGSFNASDLIFIYKGKKIQLNEKIEDVFKDIGEDNSVSELPKGRIEYDYEDFSLTTYTVNSIERVEQITVTSDTIGTQKGAKIGMYATGLSRVYGDPSESKGNSVIYGSESKTLEFTYKDNIVTGFAYKYKS